VIPLINLVTANCFEGPQKVKAPKITSRIELEKRLAELNRLHCQLGQRNDQLRDLRRNEVAEKASVNSGPVYSIEKSATRGLDRVPHRFLKPVGGRFHRRICQPSQYAVGLRNRVQAIACRIEKRGPMASLDLETLEIERSER
jgi:hypothetical protein